MVALAKPHLSTSLAGAACTSRWPDIPSAHLLRGYSLTTSKKINIARNQVCRNNFWFLSLLSPRLVRFEIGLELFWPYWILTVNVLSWFFGRILDEFLDDFWTMLFFRRVFSHQFFPTSFFRRVFYDKFFQSGFFKGFWRSLCNPLSKRI